MNGLVQAFALLAALIHIAVGILECAFYDRPAVRIFLTRSAADAPEVTLWRFFVGVYNILLGTGIISGIAAQYLGYDVVGRTLIFFVCGFMVASGIVFLFTAPRLWRGAVGQILPPAIAIVVGLL